MADTPCQPPGKGRIKWTWAGAGNKGNTGTPTPPGGTAIRGAGPSPKKGEGVPRKLSGYECNKVAIQGPIIRLTKGNNEKQE